MKPIEQPAPRPPLPYQATWLAHCVGLAGGALLLHLLPPGSYNDFLPLVLAVFTALLAVLLLPVPAAPRPAYLVYIFVQAAALVLLGFWLYQRLFIWLAPSFQASYYLPF